MECTLEQFIEEIKNWGDSRLLFPARYRYHVLDSQKFHFKKVIERSARLIWSAEKVKCEANRGNNWAKLTEYASCSIF